MSLYLAHSVLLGCSVVTVVPSIPDASLPPHLAVVADLIASFFFHKELHKLESVAVSLTPIQTCFGVLKEWLLFYQKWRQTLFPPELPFFTGS